MMVMHCGSKYFFLRVNFLYREQIDFNRVRSLVDSIWLLMQVNRLNLSLCFQVDVFRQFKKIDPGNLFKAQLSFYKAPNLFSATPTIIFCL